MKEIKIDKKIKELREIRGWSQEELAEKCYVKQACVSKWERGVTFPPLVMLVQLAELFEVSTDYLLGLSDY